MLTSRSEIDDSQPFDQIFYAAPWYNSPRDRGFHSLEPHLMEPIPSVSHHLSEKY